LTIFRFLPKRGQNKVPGPSVTALEPYSSFILIRVEAPRFWRNNEGLKTYRDGLLGTNEYKARQKKRLTQKYELKLGYCRRIRHKDRARAAGKFIPGEPLPVRSSSRPLGLKSDSAQCLCLRGQEKESGRPSRGDIMVCFWIHLFFRRINKEIV
jgi:hypothetical protein